MSLFELSQILPDRAFSIRDATLNAQEVLDLLASEDPGGAHPKHKRLFVGDGEIFKENDKTYILSNQWGIGTIDLINKLIDKYPKFSISVSQVF